MPRIGNLNINTIATAVALVLSLGSLLIAYGRSDASSAADIAYMKKQIETLNSDIKSKTDLERDLQLDVRELTVRIDELNKRLDRAEGMRHASTSSAVPKPVLSVSR